MDMFKMRRAPRLIALAACAGALAFGACGDDDESDSGNAPAAAAGATAETGTAEDPAAKTTAVDPAKKPILIGSQCDCTGSVSSSGGGWNTVMGIWAKDVNARGGILGHKVELVTHDTKSDPAEALIGAKELLLEKKVVAMVPGGGQMTTLVKVVDQAKAPLIGGQNTDASFSNQYLFPSGTSPAGLIAAVAKVGAAGKPGGKGAVMYCAEAPSCAALPKLLKAASADAGAPLVYSAAVSAGQPDYTAQCVTAKQKGATWIYVSHASAIVNRVIASCAKNGYKPIWVQPTFDASYLKSADLKDGNMHAIFADALYNSPAAAEYRAAVERYEPEFAESPLYGSFAFQAWLGGKLIEKAIETAAPTGDEVTREDVFKGLYALKDETLDGAAPPLNFVKGKPTTITCYFVGQLKDGEVTQTGGVQC